MKRELVEGLAYAGFMLVLSAGAVVGHKLGYIDHDTVTRIVMTPIGLWMVWYGNRIPKTFVRNAQARGVQRVSGWSQVLSGLTYAGLWLFAPIPVATWYGSAAVLAGVAITFGYCLTVGARKKAA